jgi:hypothetical protein
MALKNLTENEMVEVSSAWLDPQRGGAALDAYPLLAALRPAVQRAHEGLLAGDGERGDAARDKERSGLYERGVALDQRHDRKGRGAFNLLGALADLSDDPAEAGSLLALQRALFPDGNLAVLAASWKGEAGNARRVRQQVLGDKATGAALKAIPTAGRRTLLDAVRDFVGAGEALGGVEDQRVALGGDGGRHPLVAGEGAQPMDRRRQQPGEHRRWAAGAGGRRAPGAARRSDRRRGEGRRARAGAEARGGGSGSGETGGGRRRGVAENGRRPVVDHPRGWRRSVAVGTGAGPP